jgi:hypothetical protein
MGNPWSVCQILRTGHRRICCCLPPPKCCSERKTIPDCQWNYLWREVNADRWIENWFSRNDSGRFVNIGRSASALKRSTWKETACKWIHDFLCLCNGQFLGTSWSHLYLPCFRSKFEITVSRHMSEMKCLRLLGFRTSVQNLYPNLCHALRVFNIVTYTTAVW